MLKGAPGRFRASLGAPGPLTLEFLPEKFKGQRIDDVLARESGFACNAGAEPQETCVFEAMGVAVNDAFNAFTFGVWPESPVEIEAVRACIEFDPGARFSASIDNGALVDVVGLAFEQKPAGKVSEHMDEAISSSAD